VGSIRPFGVLRNLRALQFDVASLYGARARIKRWTNRKSFPHRISLQERLFSTQSGRQRIQLPSPEKWRCTGGDGAALGALPRERSSVINRLSPGSYLSGLLAGGSAKPRGRNRGCLPEQSFSVEAKGCTLPTVCVG
jgi:hypothetical protein